MNSFYNAIRSNDVEHVTAHLKDKCLVVLVPFHFIYFSKHNDFSFEVDVINYEKFNCTPPPLFAVQCGSVDVLSALIKHGVAVWQVDEFDNTALHWAARSSSVKCVEILTINDIFLKITTWIFEQF